jgi:hypothetical protein
LFFSAFSQDFVSYNYGTLSAPPARAALVFLFRTRGDALDARAFFATGLVTEMGEAIMDEPMDPFMAVFISVTGKPFSSCSLGDPLRFPKR